MASSILYTTMRSPIGELLLLSDGEALTGLYMETRKWAPTIDDNFRQDLGPFKRVRQQLELYFRGHLKIFDVPVRAKGTLFQERVWKALTKIPYGETISYGELAKRIESPNAQRPVGMANGRNPIGIIVPCHRVIGKDGSLTGYGGGLKNKQKLLALESRLHRQDL